MASNSTGGGTSDATAVGVLAETLLVTFFVILLGFLAAITGFFPKGSGVRFYPQPANWNPNPSHAQHR